MAAAHYTTTRIIAHRGAGRHRPGNTLAAFQWALDTEGIDGVEMDVRLSADGQLVTHHDSTVTCDCGRVAAVSKVSAAHLQQHWQIPTLRDVLTLCLSTKKLSVIVIEMKVNLVNQLLDLLHELVDVDDRYRIRVSSFYPAFISMFMVFGDLVFSTAYIAERFSDDLLQRAVKFGVNDLHLSAKWVTAEIIEKCHAPADYTHVMLWTEELESSEEVARYRAMKPDFLCLNEPLASLD